MERDKMIAQLIERRDEYNVKRLELEKEYKRNESMYLAYGLFEKCLNDPVKIPLSRINKEIADRKEWLEENDLILLRGIFGLVKADLDVVLADVLGAENLDKIEK